MAEDAAEKPYLHPGNIIFGCSVRLDHIVERFEFDLDPYQALTVTRTIIPGSGRSWRRSGWKLYNFLLKSHVCRPKNLASAKALYRTCHKIH